MEENPYKAPGGLEKPRFKVSLLEVTWLVRTILTIAVGIVVVLPRGGIVLLAWTCFMALPGSILAGRVKQLWDKRKQDRLLDSTAER